MHRHIHIFTLDSHVPSALMSCEWTSMYSFPCEKHRTNSSNPEAKSYGPHCWRNRPLLPQWPSPAQSSLDRVGSQESLFYPFGVLIEPVWDLCGQPQLLWAHKCKVLVMSRKYYFLAFLFNSGVQSLPFLPSLLPEIKGKSFFILDE